MSNLYRIVNLEKTIGNSISISIEAVNHEDQKIPEKVHFYFAVIASIYWDLSKFHKSFGFGIYIEEYISQEKIDFKVPILEEYIGYLDENIDYGLMDYNGIFWEEDFEKIASQFISIEIIEQKRNQYKCLEAEVIVKTGQKEFLDILNRVKKVGIVFDEDYF